MRKNIVLLTGVASLLILAFANPALAEEGNGKEGKKETITVDDYIPIYNGKPLGNINSKQDGDWWATILEKAWAKVNNNYESINWGW